MTTISTAISNTTPNGGAPSRIQDVNNGRSQVGQPVGGGTGTGGNTGGTGGTGGNTGGTDGNGGGTVDNGEVAGNDGAPSNASGQTTTISTAEYNRLVRAAAASTSGLGAFSPVGGAGLGAAMGLFSALPRMLGGGGLFGGGRGGCSGGGGGSGASGIAGAHDRAGNFGDRRLVEQNNREAYNNMTRFLDAVKPDGTSHSNFSTNLDKLDNFLKSSSGDKQLVSDIKSFVNGPQAQDPNARVQQFNNLNQRLSAYTDDEGQTLSLRELATDSDISKIEPKPVERPETDNLSRSVNFEDI